MKLESAAHVNTAKVCDRFRFMGWTQNTDRNLLRKLLLYKRSKESQVLLLQTPLFVQRFRILIAGT